jgi:hypothetical protein
MPRNIRIEVTNVPNPTLNSAICNALLEYSGVTELKQGDEIELRLVDFNPVNLRCQGSTRKLQEFRFDSAYNLTTELSAIFYFEKLPPK